MKSRNTLTERFPSGMSGHRTRQPKDKDAGPFQPAITSFELHLRAERKSEKTVLTYVEAAQWFAAVHLRRQTDCTDWDEVRREHVQEWMVSLLKRYSDSYCSNQYQALQQFFKWWSDDEDLPDPMAKTKPPTVDPKVVPVVTDDELKRLCKACEDRSFEQRRDYAIITLFKDTGMRLAELAGIEHRPNDPERNDLDLTRREVRLHGKGGKQRIVRFGHTTARAIDRYLRARAKHKWTDHGLGEQVAGAGEDLHTCGGWGEGPAGAVQQPHSEDPLQREQRSPVRR